MQYNEAQLRAINAPEANTVIIAPAGSGKTSTIIGAVEKYRNEHPLQHIVTITFTRKAADELKERMTASNIEISTIHSWAYRRLQALSAEYGFRIHLLEDDAIKEILKNISRQCRQFYLNQFQLFAYVMGNYNVDVDDSIKKIFEIIRCKYIDFKRKNKLYDFTDLPEYLLNMLNEYEQEIYDIDALFVDEFQDVDPIQLTLFNMVHTKRKCYIGDYRQSIYAFRGAVEEVFDQLTDFTTYTLDINYRSYQEIIDYAVYMRERGLYAIENDDVYEIKDTDIAPPQQEIICKRGNGAKVWTIPSFGQCLDITEQIECDNVLIIKHLLFNKRTQILCRANKQVKKLQALGIDNVSTIHQAKGLEYDNVIVVSFPVDCNEELNVAYVACTRAKNELCVVDFETLLYIICNENIQLTKKLF